jgi:hypothetical protein
MAETSINRYNLGEIIHGSLGLRKLASRWIPHELTDQNRRERVEACLEKLAKFEDKLTTSYLMLVGFPKVNIPEP